MRESVYVCVRETEWVWVSQSVCVWVRNGVSVSESECAGMCSTIVSVCVWERVCERERRVIVSESKCVSVCMCILSHIFNFLDILHVVALRERERECVCVWEHGFVSVFVSVSLCVSVFVSASMSHIFFSWIFHAEPFLIVTNCDYPTRRLSQF